MHERQIFYGFFRRLGLWGCSLLLLGALNPLFAQPEWTMNRHLFILDSLKNEFQDLNYYLEVFTDSTNSYHIDEITSREVSKQFALYSQMPRLNPNYTHWGRLSLINNLKTDKEWVLFLGIANFAEGYFPKNPHSGYGTDWYIQKSGRLVKADEKAINMGRDCAIPLIMGHLKKPITMYFKMRSIDNRPPDFRLMLQTRKKWDENFLKRNLFQGFFQGLMWILIIYHLASFFLIRDISYLQYAFYMLGASIYYLSVHGFLTETILRNYPTLNEYTWIASVYTISPLYFLFIRSFFHLRTFMPVWDKIITVWIVFKFLVVGVFLMIVFFTFNIGTPNRTAAALTILDPLVTFAFVIALIRKGNQNATFVIMGALALNILMMINYAYIVLYHSGKNDTSLIQIGVSLEVLFFAIGLADREKRKEKERQAIQMQFIEQLQENEVLKTQANQALEQKVRERTLEIVEKNRTLEHQKEEILSSNELLTVQRNELMIQKQEVERQKSEIMGQHDLIEEKNKILKNQHDKMLDSIRYALTIQQAILPNDRVLAEYFTQFFVIYRPKDIVAGDFYWITKTEKYMYAAVVDCTGHGVPGAFMSLIAETLLNEIVSVEGISETSAILETLQVKIVKVLNQAEKANQDGMDICLCRLEHLELGIKLSFTGAKRPLYYVLPDSTEVQIAKGDVKSLGGIRKLEKRFTQTEISLLPKSVLYLTSDGIIDQNSPSNEKFGTAKLKQVLETVKGLDLEQQRIVIEKKIEKHQLDAEQRDDITLLGLMV